MIHCMILLFGFWCQVSGFGFRVSGFRFRVSGFRFQVSGFRFQVSGFRFQVSGFGFQVSGFRFQVSGFGFQVSAICILHILAPGTQYLRTLQQNKTQRIFHARPVTISITPVNAYAQREGSFCYQSSEVLIISGFRSRRPFGEGHGRNGSLQSLL